MTKKKLVIAGVVLLGLMALLHLVHVQWTEGHGHAAQPHAQELPQR